MGVGRAGSGDGDGSGAGGALTTIEFEDGIRAIRGSGLGDGGAESLPWDVARLLEMPFRRPSPVMEPCFRAGSSPKAMGW